MKKITKKEEKRLEKKRKNKLWKEVRQKVLERDNHECLICQSNFKLNVHHILEKEFIMFRDLQFDERNLITVCPKCHKYGQFSFHKTPIYALEVFKKKYPANYKFLLNQINKYHKLYKGLNLN
jgi:5-methylcytosine-specific restriction endonuclease McrA